MMLSVTMVQAQEIGFPFGQVTYRELGLTQYEKDTSASALVLREFGEAFISSETGNLHFNYHIKIKILKKSGLKLGDYEIPLRKAEGGREERLMDIQAVSVVIENGSMKSYPLNRKNVYQEDVNSAWNETKFAIPNVQVGGVIEVQYTLESPFRYNFREWNFQTDIPKLLSEYKATIPANYTYNIALRGFLKLSKNETGVERDCFRPGGQHADCSTYFWAMQDIPAFVEEEYVTAKSNFMSAIVFELSQFQDFDGRKDKFTKEWKDAEDELNKDEGFGVQLKRGKNLFEKDVIVLAASAETDPLIKARKIYDGIRHAYRWNDTYGFFCDAGIKKAYETKTGNVGDINLSLVAALRAAGFVSDPMILSTRRHGLPTDLYPVLSQFNYVVARVEVGDKAYLLDATDDFVPFGTLPEHCLNGKGRVFGEQGSYWMDIKPLERKKKISRYTLKIDKDGHIRGTLQTTYFGYQAAELRYQIYKQGSEEAYVKDKSSKLKHGIITGHQYEHVADPHRPLVEKLEVDLEGFDEFSTDHLLFNPFFIDRIEKNPFRSSERLYPVDFGAPLEDVLTVSIELPAGFEVTDLPNKVALALPNGGGRYIFEVQQQTDKLLVSQSLLIAKTVFTSVEYHYLKELFNSVVEANQTTLVLKRKQP